MELIKDNAAVRLNSIGPHDTTISESEIDLYHELIAFAELPPEEQLRVVEQTSQPEPTSADSTEGLGFSEQVHNQVLDESATAISNIGLPETTQAEEFESLALSRQLNTEEQTSSEPPVTYSPFEPIESGKPAPEEDSVQDYEALVESVDTDDVRAPAPAEDSVQDYEVRPVETDDVLTPATAENFVQDYEVKSVDTDDVLTQATAEHLVQDYAVESVDTDDPQESATAEDSVQHYEVPVNSVDTDDVRTPFVRPSGPLSGFNLPPEIVYTGALSPGVCLACGAESGADDLFCVTCGVFIDEIGSTLPANPTCGECDQRIEEDEIFCPWCGSLVPA